MNEPVWLSRDAVLAMHDALLAEHGGAAGLRDVALLESALARPPNQFAYGEIDICALAAANAAGIVRNHPFMDGNKRTAFLSAYVFLRRNGITITAGEASATATMIALASSDVSDAEFAAWLRDNSHP